MSARSDFVWGVVGPGAIAHQFCRSLAAAGAGRVGPVLSRSRERAAVFCAEHGGEPAATLDALIERMQREPERQRAVYVATPHALHAEAVRPCLEAGVAVLCEKPLTCDPITTEDLIDLACTNGAPLAEAYMYRAHPQIERVRDFAREHDLGEPLELRSSFCFHAPFDPSHRLFAPELGGGAVLDVGGYPISLAMALAGSTDMPEPIEIDGDVLPNGVEFVAEARLRFGPRLVLEAKVALDRDSSREALVTFERGTVAIEDPFMPEARRDGRIGRLTLTTAAGATHEEEVVAPHDCYGLEAHAFEVQVARGEIDPRPPLVTHAESLTLASVLEAWRTTVGAQLPDRR